MIISRGLDVHFGFGSGCSCGNGYRGGNAYAETGDEDVDVIVLGGNRLSWKRDGLVEGRGGSEVTHCK